MAVQLGKHYTGKPKGFANTETGEFWYALPALSPDEQRLQLALRPLLRDSQSRAATWHVKAILIEEAAS